MQVNRISLECDVQESHNTYQLASEALWCRYQPNYRDIMGLVFGRASAKGGRDNQESQRNTENGVHGRSNENKMSDGGRGRALLGLEVWKSSQKGERSAVRRSPHRMVRPFSCLVLAKRRPDPPRQLLAIAGQSTCASENWRSITKARG